VASSGTASSLFTMLTINFMCNNAIPQKSPC
jgi:hypothetical protein